MILVFPKETYITILPALYSLKLDHFSQVSSCCLMPSRPCLVPLRHLRLVLPCCPHLTLSHCPRRTSPCHPCPISPSHPWPITNHQLFFSTRTSPRFLPQDWRRAVES